MQLIGILELSSVIKKIPVIKILLDKRLIKVNATLNKFGQTHLKFAPKLTLRKLKKNKSYSPDVGEDDGVRIPRGKNRAAK